MVINKDWAILMRAETQVNSSFHFVDNHTFSIIFLTAGENVVLHIWLK